VEILPTIISRGSLTKLQWGHDFSAVEIERNCAIVSPGPLASMGPRLFSRGNKIESREYTVSSSGLQWGHDFSAVEMGRYLRQVRSIDMLQWGHDFSAVEIGYRR